MKKLQKLTLTAAMIALVFLMTLFLKIPIGNGYIHLGDGAFLAFGAVFGFPYALAAGALGEGLADLASGYAIYAPATALIKASMALFMIFRKKEKALCLLNVLLALAASVVNVGGYFVADLVIDKTYAVANLASNAVQSAGGFVTFILLTAALEKVKPLIEKRVG